MTKQSDDTWAVLFDLDDTLVMTSSLESLRRSGNWKAVYSSFEHTSLPLGTMESLAALRRSQAILGIVTKSPRTYAERLSGHHSLGIPVLVAYHDVTRKKPHPEALYKACQIIKIPPSRCIYIGDHPDDIAAARAAGCTPIGVCWAALPRVLDIERVCTTWPEVLSEITRITATVPSI